MQVRQYPFQIDAPLSPALRDTMLVASFVARACRSVLRARDQRVRAARVVEVPARAQAEVPAFRSALGECGIEVVEFDQTLSSLMADPDKAPTVKELVGSLAGKRAAAPDLGARVQELLARCGAAPRTSGMATAAASPPQTSPGPQPSAAPPAPRAAPAASRRDRPRSKDFRWDLTAAARAGECRPSPETEPPEAAAPSSAPAPDVVSGDVRAERTTAQTDATPTTAGTTPDESPGAPTVPPANATNGSPATGPVAPPLKDDVVPTEVGIVIALEELGRQSENLQRRVEAIEALVASQARRLEEAERKLEAVLRRIEAREEAARKQAENLARAERELAELRERVARVEARPSEVSPLRVTPKGSANEAPPVMAAAATEDAQPNAPEAEVQPTTGPGVPSEEAPVAEEAPTAHPSSTPTQTHSPEGAATAAKPTGDAPTFAAKAKSEAHGDAADSSPAEDKHEHAAQPSQQVHEAKLDIAGMERRLRNAEERLTSTEAKVQNTTKITEQIEQMLGKGG